MDIRVQASQASFANVIRVLFPMVAQEPPLENP